MVAIGSRKLLIFVDLNNNKSSMKNFGSKTKGGILSIVNNIYTIFLGLMCISSKHTHRTWSVICMLYENGITNELVLNYQVNIIE